MRRVLKTNHKRELGGLDILAALTLTMSLAVFGCTTNKYPGNGEPQMGPMKSSSTDAIAILQANEAYRGKILGPADPGGPQRSEIAPPVPAINSGGVESAIVVPTAGSPSVTAASATVSAPSATTTITSATAGTTVPVITTPLTNTVAVSNRVVTALQR